jgi:hypothetical protein
VYAPLDAFGERSCFSRSDIAYGKKDQILASFGLAKYLTSRLG